MKLFPAEGVAEEETVNGTRPINQHRSFSSDFPPLLPFFLPSFIRPLPRPDDCNSMHHVRLGIRSRASGHNPPPPIINYAMIYMQLFLVYTTSVVTSP